MGYIQHDAVIVTVSGYANDRDFAPGPKVKAFRESLPEEWRALVVGPVRSVVNGYDTYAFLPDGSKEGWRDSDQGDEYRSQFDSMWLRSVSAETSRWSSTALGVVAVSVAVRHDHLTDTGR